MPLKNYGIQEELIMCEHFLWRHGFGQLGGNIFYVGMKERPELK